MVSTWPDEQFYREYPFIAYSSFDSPKKEEALERRTRKERIEYEESYERIIVRKRARKQTAKNHYHIFERRITAQ